MVIDMNVSPAFIEEAGLTEEELKFCREKMGLYKTDTAPVSYLKTLARVSGVDMLCLLPLDLTVEYGKNLGSNDQVERLVREHPDFFLGCASVDPRRNDARDELDRAFFEQGLAGLILNPALQGFSLNDERLYALLEQCENANKPVIFHAGMSACPSVSSANGHPMLFEDIALSFPHLRICLQHFGWPWAREVCMLMLKNRNVFTDLSCLYLDNPREFYGHLFTAELGEHWIDRSFRHQVMFASEEPRLEMHRMAIAIREQSWRASTLDLVMGGNAMRFFNGGEIDD